VSQFLGAGGKPISEQWENVHAEIWVALVDYVVASGWGHLLH